MGSRDAVGRVLGDKGKISFAQLVVYSGEREVCGETSLTVDLQGGCEVCIRNESGVSSSISKFYRLNDREPAHSCTFTAVVIVMTSFRSGAGPLA